MQHITPIGLIGNACTNLTGNSEGNFKINLKSVGCNGVEWIYLAEDTDEWRFLVNVYELRISIKCRLFLE